MSDEDNELVNMEKCTLNNVLNYLKCTSTKYKCEGKVEFSSLTDIFTLTFTYISFEDRLKLILDLNALPNGNIMTMDTISFDINLINDKQCQVSSVLEDTLNKLIENIQDV